MSKARHDNQGTLLRCQAALELSTLMRLKLNDIEFLTDADTLIMTQKNVQTNPENQNDIDQKFEKSV